MQRHGDHIVLALALALLAAHAGLTARFSRAGERPRLAVLTDIPGDPDDRQSLIRLMVYANEFEIEALVASAAGTPGELKEAITRPDLIAEIVNAYEEVRPNLTRHAREWPAGRELLARVASGNRTAAALTSARGTTRQARGSSPNGSTAAHHPGL